LGKSERIRFPIPAASTTTFIFPWISRTYFDFYGFVGNLNMHFLRLWGPLIIGALAAGGCSMARFGYDVLPTWAHWQVERYLNLDEAQRDIVSRHLGDLHRWHRREQLPEYVGFLREIDDGLRTRVDAADVTRWRERVGDAWQPIAERVAPGLAELAVTLRPEQIEHLRERMRKYNEDARDEHLPEGEGAREKARADRELKRAEFVLGRLGAAQARDVRAKAAALPATEEHWFAEREARQQRFVDVLERLRRERPPKALATQMVRDYLVTLWQVRDTARRHALERATAARDEMTAQVLAGATAAQRRHASKVVRGYVEDFETLAGIAETASNR